MLSKGIETSVNHILHLQTYPLILHGSPSPYSLEFDVKSKYTAIFTIIIITVLYRLLHFSKYNNNNNGDFSSSFCPEYIQRRPICRLSSIRTMVE